ncbi:GNAT family N-acetyltransferase [Micromonospora sp. NPDC000316]|uniref:GNAT family N-acetyltransferase n=1 Tax=Micromonospora sp. NPDC000316 TaxID=3364216 RepID=UPI0036869993
MIMGDYLLHDRTAILAATGHHPYARYALGLDVPTSGYQRDETVLWLSPSAYGPAASAIGPAGPAIEICGELVADGVLRPQDRLHLPRHDPALRAGRPTVDRHEDWDFHWTCTPPPEQPDERRVVRLTEADHPALEALIDEAFPGSTSRPSDQQVVNWYGIRAGGRLVACGAERSRDDVGFLAGLTVAPDQRGRGLGAALTAGMTRALMARHDTVALGVYLDNVGAARLYRRLGFTSTLGLTSVRLA